MTVFYLTTRPLPGPPYTTSVDATREILALRHQITVLERHLHGERIRLTWADRAWLAALLHQLPRDVLREIRLMVRPETVRAGTVT
jgi:hypothetical protein